MIPKMFGLSMGAALIGATVIVNGANLKVDDILSQATAAVSFANMHQFRTALDLYYIDNGQYPNVVGGAAMVDVLERGNYIRKNAPIDASDFNYYPKNNGQDYYLGVE